MKTIPQGKSLVVLIGPSGAGKSYFAARHFNPREVVSTDAIRVELTGDLRRMDKNDEVFDEFHHRIAWKLHNGQRAVADATNLRNSDRQALADLGVLTDTPVTYVVINRDGVIKHKHGGWRTSIMKKGKTLIDAMEETFVSNEQTILSGDFGTAGLVIDTRVEEFEVAYPLPRDTDAVLRHLLDRGYEYIRVIGDVHGNLHGMHQALEGVDDRGVTFFLFLGDVIDYGVDTLLTSDLAYHFVARGEAAMVRGNHERKTARWVERGEAWQGQETHGNSVTMNQVKALSAADRAAWESRFMALVEMSPDWIQIGNFLFAHAAVHPRMWGNTMARAPGNTSLESYALYGETTGEDDPETGFPIRRYDWVDELPDATTAVVGHAILSIEEPVEKRGAEGGHAVFLDTGSSKTDPRMGEGHLSWMDLEILTPKRSAPKLVARGFGRER